MVQLSYLYMTIGKTIALTIWTFVSKVMLLLFNTLSRFVLAFLPGSKHLFISWLLCFWSPRKEDLSLFPFFPHLFAMKWWDQMPQSFFWMLSFKPVYSLSSFTFLYRHFRSSLLTAIRVVSSAYLRLLMFLLAILIPACDSSSLTFHMIYSAYKLDKQGNSIQPWHTPFPI